MDELKFIQAVYLEEPETQDERLRNAILAMRISLTNAVIEATVLDGTGAPDPNWFNGLLRRVE